MNNEILDKEGKLTGKQKIVITPFLFVCPIIAVYSILRIINASGRLEAAIFVFPFFIVLPLSIFLFVVDRSLAGKVNNRYLVLVEFVLLAIGAYILWSLG